MGNSKRILFILTQADWGGAQTFVFRATREARRRGLDVLLACGGEGSMEAKCREAGIPFQKLVRMRREISPLRDLGAIRELTALMRTWKPDVLFLNSSKAGVVGSIAGRISRVPNIIYRIGGWSFLDPVSPLQKMVRLWTEKLTARLKDVIIVVHPGDAAIARHHHIRPKRALVTVPNGLDASLFDAALQARGDARRALGVTDGHAPVLLTIANFYPAKDLSGYLDALAIVAKHRPDVRAIVIGEGAQRAMLQTKRHALGLDDLVSLPGAMDNAATVFAAADAFVLPSVKEGMPWTVLEAMAAKLPIVVTDVGSNRWALGDAAWIVPPRDPQALAHAILDALRDPEAARIRGAAARRVLEERFTEQEMWGKVFGLF